MSQVLCRHAGVRIITNDLNAYEADYHDDATREEGWLGFDYAAQRYFRDRIAWTVTNPPFKHADEVLHLAYKYSAEGVAMLLRLSYLEPLRSDKRQAHTQFLVEHPPNVLINLPRMSFTNDGGTDSVIASWMVWYKSQLAPARIIVVPEEKATVGVPTLNEAEALSL
jgi:hypothetical protein